MGVQVLPKLPHDLHDEKHSRACFSMWTLYGAAAGRRLCWHAGKYGSPWSLKDQCSVVANPPVLREKKLLLVCALASCDVASQEAAGYTDLEVKTESQLPTCRCMEAWRGAA